MHGAMCGEEKAPLPVGHLPIRFTSWHTSPKFQNTEFRGNFAVGISRFGDGKKKSDPFPGRFLDSVSLLAQ
jgi:hypothetical protein